MLIAAGVLLILLAVFLLWHSARQQRQSGLPSGRVIYSDTGGWQKLEKPLYDPLAGLTGKPDYLIEQDHGVVIPVEVKSSRAPTVPYDSHVFQLAAYCLLVERVYGVRPPYGVLRYRDRTFAIDYTPALESELEDLLAAMRQDIRKQAKRGVDRSHEEPARCDRCGFRKVCDQRL